MACIFFLALGGTASGFYTVEDPVSKQICLPGEGLSGLMAWHTLD